MKAEADVYDVLIVGAGPTALATAARLRETTPAALFTDEEHRRFHWLRRHRMPLINSRSRKIYRPVTHLPAYTMLVVDSTANKWLSRWNRLFNLYDISHLRSPMIWHVDPLDRDALLAHAYAHGQEGELMEIRGCVGREMSKHAHKQRACGKRYVHLGVISLMGRQEKVPINVRDKNDYYTPSQALFSDHCNDVIDRYSLSDTIHDTVCDVDYGDVPGVGDVFTVTTGSRKYYAKAVVLAVGAANAAQMPMRITGPTCHSLQIKTFPDPVVQQRIDCGKHTNVLVVGGGLTSAQLSDLAIRRGVTHVYHVMRGPLRVKPFDVDLQWMGKYKNTEQARFWLADSDEERLAMLKEARGGGSITPAFHKRLKKHVAAGRLTLIQNTSVTDAVHDGSWDVKTEPPVEIPPVDYIYFATGIQTDVNALPYLRTMQAKYPVDSIGGFPCLNDDLMWKDGVPLFVLGRLSALKLGPAAPNIGGAKLGAERVAWALDKMLRPDSEEYISDHGSMYASGHGNKYSVLGSNG